MKLHLKLILPFIIILILTTGLNIFITIKMLNSLHTVKPELSNEYSLVLQKRKIILIQSLLIIFTVTSLFTIYFYSFIIRNYLSRPITKLISAMKRISSGGLDSTLIPASKDEIGELTGHFNSMIQTLKKSQTQLEETRSKLFQQEKLKYINTLNAGISHELNTPLSNISLHLDVIEKTGIKDDSIKKIIDNIRLEITRAASIITSLSSFSKISISKNQITDIKSEIEKILSGFKLQTEKKHLKIEITDNISPYKIKLNIEGLKIVIANIIKNAVEILNDNGTIKIIIDKHENGVSIKINDNGPGLPLKIKDKIFDPFFSLNKKSTGLGLAISSEIVKNNNGMIKAENNKDGGASFEIIFPVSL